MTDDDTMDLLAGEYVLGTLQGAERERFEARLQTDTQAMQAVAAWEERLLPLSEPTEQVEPSNDAWKSIQRSIALETWQAKSVTIRADEGEWQQHSPGVNFKLLNVDPEAGTQSYLLRLDPGAAIEPHDHLGEEECLMLSGDVTFGDGELTLRAGDYHMIPKGVWHCRAYSANGCTAFIRAHV